MQIIVDTREQKPYFFSELPVQVISDTLTTGDYSLRGFESKIAFERKELSDLISCFGTGRERFERELHRARGFEHFAVIVEANYSEVLAGNWRHRINVATVLNSIRSFEIHYNVHFIFEPCRKKCQNEIYERFRLFLRRRGDEMTAIRLHRKAHKGQTETSKQVKEAV